MAEKSIVIGLCFTLGVESTALGHAKMREPHLEPIIYNVSLAEPLRSNYVYSAAASAVNMGDLGVRVGEP
jgi:hypothetical protein